jgi:hypothetical protein
MMPFVLSPPDPDEGAGEEVDEEEDWGPTVSAGGFVTWVVEAVDTPEVVEGVVVG